MRRAEDRDPADLTAIEQLARDDAGFDRLADADVVRDQQADGVELERHHERDELVRPRFDSDAAEAAERPRCGARRETRRIAEDLPRCEVTDVRRRREAERRRL